MTSDLYHYAFKIYNNDNLLTPIVLGFKSIHISSESGFIEKDQKFYSNFINDIKKLIIKDNEVQFALNNISFDDVYIHIESINKL